RLRKTGGRLSSQDAVFVRRAAVFLPGPLSFFPDRRLSSRGVVFLPEPSGFFVRRCLSSQSVVFVIQGARLRFETPSCFRAPLQRTSPISRLIGRIRTTAISVKTMQTPVTAPKMAGSGNFSK